jgi:hypothetical protein
MQKFIQTDDKTLAFRACPWACIVKRVDGGYMCFETLTGYRTWKNQK